MYKRFVVYCIISLFIIVILLQLNSNLPLVSIPHTTTNTTATSLTQHERYQRDYTTLVSYISILMIGSIILLFSSWFQQYKYKKNKLLGFSIQPRKITSWQRWSRHEWRFLSSTWSLQRLLQLGCLVGLNVLLLFRDSTVLARLDQESSVLLEDRNIYLQLLANRSAQLCLTNIAMSVVLSAKLSLLQRHFFDIHQTLQWHSWFGRIGFIQVLYHGTYQLQYNYTRQDGDLYLTFFTNIRHITGSMMASALIVLILGSHPIVRMLSYRLFRWTHLTAFMTLILFGCFHHWAFYVFYATVFIFWVTDQIDRSFITKSCKIEQLPGNIVKLKCQVPFASETLIPGQFAFISFGSTSWIKACIHSHPFSICRIDGENYFTFYIKANGKKTYKLQQFTEIEARISKPLGRPYITKDGSEVGDYENIIFVSEGMGITPWISVLNYIEDKQHAIKTETVHFIWSIHSLDTFYAFEKEFKSLLDNKIPQELKFHVFITGSTIEEEYDLPTDYPFIQFSIETRPNYTQLLHDMNTANTVLGICAHEETSIKLNNLGLFYSFNIISERFEL